MPADLTMPERTDKELLALVSEYLELAPELPSGLKWKKRSSRRVQLGASAGTKGGNGYFGFRLKGLRLLNHRAIFLMANGYLPEIVDHVDGNVNNNAPRNIRAATSSQNNQNTGVYRNNKSGVPGVYWERSSGSWRAAVSDGGRQIRKRFKSFDEAVDWRIEQEHSRYKDFSPRACRHAG